MAYELDHIPNKGFFFIRTLSTLRKALEGLCERLQIGLLFGLVVVEIGVADDAIRGIYELFVSFVVVEDICEIIANCIDELAVLYGEWGDKVDAVMGLGE